MFREHPVCKRASYTRVCANSHTATRADIFYVRPFCGPRLLVRVIRRMRVRSRVFAPCRRRFIGKSIVCKVNYSASLGRGGGRGSHRRHSRRTTRETRHGRAVALRREPISKPGRPPQVACTPRVEDRRAATAAKQRLVRARVAEMLVICREECDEIYLSLSLSLSS